MDRDLLEGARRAISLHGWRGATMERIAEEVGISRMTLHRRGISRHRILEGLAGRLEEEYRAAFWPALTASGSGRERLEAALRKQCEVTERNLAVLEALEARDREAVFHEGAGEEDGPVMTRKEFTGAYRRLLEDGVADGTLAAGDAGETASVLFNLVGLTYRHLRLGHRWELEKAERAVVGVAMRGVVAR